MSGTLSAIARGQHKMPRWLYVVALIVVIGLAGFMFYWAYLWPDPPKPAPGPESDQSASANFSMGTPLQEAPLPQTKPAMQAPPSPPDHPADPPKPEPSAPPPPPTVVSVAPMLVWTRQDGEALLKGKTPPKPAPAEGEEGEDGQHPPSGPASPYAQSTQATQITDTRPRFKRFPPRYTLRKGDNISCTPPMPLDTQLPGPLWCLVDFDVLSMDKANILIPAGSQVNLQLEHGLGLGQDRAIIVATDVLTTGPNYLPIPLDAIGASSSGQNGVPVDVHEHTWARVKQAALAAGIEGLSSAASNALQSGGNQYIGGFGSQTQSLAAIFAQRDVNIPVTGYRGAGRPISIYINHYVDLSDYYENILSFRK